MFWRRTSRAFGTVTARLTLLYLLGSTLALTITLAVAERNLRRHLERGVDDSVIQILVEYLDLDWKLSKEGGNQARLRGLLQSAFERTRTYHGAERVYLCLLGPDGERLAGVPGPDWVELPARLPALPAARSPAAEPALGDGGGGWRYVTWSARRGITPPFSLALGTRGRAGSRARLGLGRLAASETLLVAVSLREADLVMQRLRASFLVGFGALVLLAAPLGYLLGRRAMAGVSRVTATARRIAAGDLSQRVASGREGREIQELATAFNHMLERLQALLTGLGRVSSNVAHDLRSPIARMRGVAETTMLSEASLEEHREACGIVVEECDRLLGMTNTVLEIAKMDAGVVDVRSEPVDAAQIVTDAFELFQPAAEDRGLTLELRVPPGPLLVSGTRALLQRALANLVDNAVKFTDAPGQVVLAAERRGDAIVVSVSDSGQGIRSEDVPRIFERFYRADQSRSLPGSGLGLSLARSIVLAHGGQLAVSSEVGAGAAFSIHLPATGSRPDSPSE